MFLVHGMSLVTSVYCMGWDASSDMFLVHGMFPIVSSAWDVSGAWFLLDYVKLYYLILITILDYVRLCVWTEVVVVVVVVVVLVVVVLIV